MPELNSNIVAEVVQACQQGADEAAAAMGRALGCQVTLTVGTPSTWAGSGLAQAISGPGLAVALTVGKSGALLLLPETSGLLPSWYTQPDATGTSKLTTLAQELGMVLLPEAYFPDDYVAGHVANLNRALGVVGLDSTATVVPLELHKSDGHTTTAHLLWPAANPKAVFTVAAAPASPSSKAAPSAPAPPWPAPAPKASSHSRAASVKDLPLFSRSLLRVKVPVVVTLAHKRQRLSRIMEIGPGSILQFDKSCEETLELDVGGHRVARGEAVKIGDKFGLRIQAMVLPEERFLPVRNDVDPRRKPG